MNGSKAVALGILCGVLGTTVLAAADFSNYRGFQFGMGVAAAAKEVGIKPTEVRLIHQRPAVIQEIDWRPRSSVLVDSAKADPVQDGLLCFYGGELYRIVVTYDRYRITGMTVEDLIEGISAAYGPATRPTAQVPYHSFYGEAAAVIARWDDPQYEYNLVQTGDQSTYALVMYSKRLETLARSAAVEAVRLDALEAPRRELELQKVKDDEERLALEKARLLNKPKFRP